MSLRTIPFDISVDMKNSHAFVRMGATVLSLRTEIFLSCFKNLYHEVPQPPTRRKPDLKQKLGNYLLDTYIIRERMYTPLNT